MKIGHSQTQIRIPHREAILAIWVCSFKIFKPKHRNFLKFSSRPTWQPRVSFWRSTRWSSASTSSSSFPPRQRETHFDDASQLLSLVATNSKTDGVWNRAKTGRSCRGEKETLAGWKSRSPKSYQIKAGGMKGDDVLEVEHQGWWQSTRRLNAADVLQVMWAGEDPTEEEPEIPFVKEISSVFSGHI